jgi:SAM-dependent methyltransferase
VRTVNFIARLRSFRRRRILIPVDHTSLVLDVGSGDKPHWRADVLLDRYPDDEHGGQRSGTSAVRVDRPLFDADAADMPFADKVFDYAICSHVLEHVEHPDAVLAELSRVAKAGYVEVPEAASAKIVDFPSHLWWVTIDDGVLVFTAKSTPYFDADIDRYLTASGLRQHLADLLDHHIDHRVIELPWTDSITCRVVGTPSAELIEASRAPDAHHRGLDALAARLMTAVLTVPLRRRKHRGPILYDDIVRPDLRTARHEPLSATIYRPTRRASP